MNEQMKMWIAERASGTSICTVMAASREEAEVEVRRQLLKNQTRRLYLTAWEQEGRILKEYPVVKTLDREGLLGEIEKLGESLATKADPSNYPFEKMGQAKQYQGMLMAARRAYSAIKGGQNLAFVLRWLQGELSGIESNQVSLLYKACTTGFASTDAWMVVDGKLVSKSNL